MIPANKLTAVVLSKASDRLHSFNAAHHICSMAPLPTTQFTGPKKDDLTGRKAGRFTVVGFSAIRSKSNSAPAGRWVCRCACGRYQVLSSKSIKKNHEDTMCVECVKTRRTKWHLQNEQNRTHFNSDSRKA